MKISERIQTIESEGMKDVAESTLHHLSKSELGRMVIERYAFNGHARVEDPVLHTELAGIDFENPLCVAAGWDKKGRAVNGLYALGYAGAEVGTVPLFGQPGNPKPRMTTEGRRHAVGRNWLGFNSIGSEGVERNLDSYPEIQGRLGVNAGLNKLMPHERSPWAHAEVVKRLYQYADYFVFNPSSPNTPDLRELQRQESVRDHIKSMQEAMEESGGQKPLFVKFAPDVAPDIFEGAVAAAVEERASGLILANTIISESIKKMYGVEGQPGGISGDNAVYRAIVTRMIYETYEHAGDKLDIIGVGGVSTYEHVLEYMMAGASVVQQLTAIRPSWGRSAARINTDLLQWCEDHRVQSIKELIGCATKRGSKYPAAA